MIHSYTKQVCDFWQRAQAVMDIRGEKYHSSTFVDTELSQKADTLALAARSGQKRATAHLKLEFETRGMDVRFVGDYWIVLDGALSPVCIVQLSEVDVRPFCEVGEQLALAEGEGDLSLEYWREVHRKYFVRQCRQWGAVFSEDLPVVGEYFDLCFPLK